MKRFHVHVAVENLEQSIRFYSTLFGMAPAARRPDYAKWMLEDPRVNFAISERGRTAGVNHLGLQVDSSEELAAMRDQLTAADKSMVEQQGIACCYARSDKYWVTDPSGIAWETFHSLDTLPFYGEDDRSDVQESACCAAPAAPEQQASAYCAPSADQVREACCN